MAIPIRREIAPICYDVLSTDVVLMPPLLTVPTYHAVVKELRSFYNSFTVKLDTNETGKESNIRFLEKQFQIR